MNQNEQNYWVSHLRSCLGKERVHNEAPVSHFQPLLTGYVSQQWLRVQNGAISKICISPNSHRNTVKKTQQKLIGPYLPLPLKSHCAAEEGSVGIFDPTQVSGFPLLFNMNLPCVCVLSVWPWAGGLRVRTEWRFYIFALLYPEDWNENYSCIRLAKTWSKHSQNQSV